jgi:drug/metabolite transporter (DMT)-like permease
MSQAVPPPSVKADTSRNRLIGIVMICGALLCFSFLDGTAKWLNQSIPSIQTVWARYASNVLIVCAILSPITHPRAYRPSRLSLQLIRSFLLFFSTLMNFFALRYLQLAETMSISFVTPLLVALFAVPILGERVGLPRMLAILVGFGGVLVVMRPGMSGFNPAALLTLIGCVAYALYSILTRMLAAHDPPQTTMVFSGLVGFAMVSLLVPLVWVTPQNWTVIVAMVAMGAFASTGHFLLILAHQRAPASTLMPFMYTQLIWMIVIGYLAFGDVPDSATLLGGAIVIASGLYLLWQERRQGQARDSNPSHSH